MCESSPISSLGTVTPTIGSALRTEPRRDNDCVAGSATFCRCGAEPATLAVGDPRCDPSRPPPSVDENGDEWFVSKTTSSSPDADPCVEPATLDEPTTVLWTLRVGTPNVTDPQAFFGGINAGMVYRLGASLIFCDPRGLLWPVTAP